MGRFAAKKPVHPASTLSHMNEDRVLQALESMRTEVAAVTGGIAGLTDLVGTMQIDIVSLKEDMVVMKAAVGGLESTVSTLQEDVREIRRDVSHLRQTMTSHLDWHLGEAS